MAKRQAKKTENVELGQEEKLRPISRLDKYVYMDDTIQLLDFAFKCNKNVILYGPGGYGKSEVSMDFLNERGIQPYVLTMGNGTTTDRLFGGMDLKKFNDDGKIEYLVENSFMNHEYVIFEELFDAQDYILEQLKDILSSRIFRNGNQIFNIKTKLIICCTNKTRESFSKNDSLKALMERFPLEHNVEWKENNSINYEHLFRKVLGNVDPFLTYILGEYSKNAIKISPRMALTSAELLMACGPDCLKFIPEFSKKPELLKSATTKFKSIEEVYEINEKFKALKSSFKIGNDVDSIKKSNLQIAELKKTLVKLKAIKADDSIVTKVSELITEIEAFIKNNEKALSLLMGISALEESEIS